MTNLDRIKNMTVAELAEWLKEISPCKCCVRNNKRACNSVSCRLGIKKWLEQEAAE